MSAADLLLDMGRLGIRLEADGERLRYFPRSALTPDLLDRLKAHKGELLATLTPVHATLVAEANRMLPPGFVLTPTDWQRLDPLERDPAAYLLELARIIRPATIPPEPTRQPWKSTTPLALADDANFTRRGVTHKLADCPATDSWRHVFGGMYCRQCWPPTDPLAVIHLNRSTT